MTWILWLVGGLVLIFVIGLVFKTNPFLIIKSIISDLIILAVLLGIANLLGYLAGSQKTGFLVGCFLFLIMCIIWIVNPSTTITGSVSDILRWRGHTEEDSRVDGWVGIVLLVSLAIWYVLNVFVFN